jgi:iron complex outermembrane receptor protein
LKREFDSGLEDGTGSVFPDNSEGWIYEFDYNEQRLQAGIDLVWQIGAGSRMLFDYSFSRSDLSDVIRPLYPDEIYEADDRKVNSLRLQEQWQPHDRILLIGGVGYDHYSDIGGQVSPKIASVFRLNARRSAVRRHILKVQYGRAFRPPTFLETHARLNALSPEPETIDTFEIGYITRKFEETFRITAFSSKLTACIQSVPGEQETYDINGFELEYTKPLLPDILKLDANLSYTMTENRDTGNEISGSADWLSNIGLTYTPLRWLSLSLQLHSVFNRNEVVPVNADSPGDTHLLDATVQLQFPENQDWTLRLGVKNAFKEDIRLYSAQTEQGEVYDFIAPGDEQPGRFLWMSLSYDF